MPSSLACPGAQRRGAWTNRAPCPTCVRARGRWYYDPKSKWYYGGEPVAEWKEVAPIPVGALFGTAPHAGGPVPQPRASLAAAGAGAGAETGAAGIRGGGGPAAGSGKAALVKQVVVALPQHPQALIGGHQAHHVTVGRVGAAKGVTGMGAAAGGASGGGGAGRGGGRKGTGGARPLSASAVL